MYKLCIFDLDGTLVDTIGDIADSLNYALRDAGCPTLTEREVAALVGNSVVWMCQNAMPEAVREDGWRTVRRVFMAHYGAHCTDRSRPYDGTIPMLARLKSAGMTVAVVSNKPHKHAMQVLSRLFPRDSFSIILGQMDKFPRKPEPTALHFVLDYFGVEPHEAVYVGDSEVDLAFAANAGVDCIAVSWGLRGRAALEAAGAVRIVDDPLELAELVNV